MFCLDRYACDEPETPVAEVFTEDDVDVIEAVERSAQLQPTSRRGQPISLDVRGWVTLLVCMTGWRPSKRRPLPGNELLRWALAALQFMVRQRRDDHARCGSGEFQFPAFPGSDPAAAGTADLKGPEQGGSTAVHGPMPTRKPESRTHLAASCLCGVGISTVRARLPETRNCRP